MSTTPHAIELYAENGEIRPRLVCTAAPDAPCRKRPTVERDSWNDEDPDLTPGHPCWAIEWVEAAGFEDGVAWGSRDGVIASIPVRVSYDEGVYLDPVTDLEAVNQLLYRYDHDPSFGVREVHAALAAARAGEDVVTRSEAERMVAEQRETDLAMHEAYRPEVVAEVAVHLSEDTDWEAVAAWCGGTIRTGSSTPSGEYESTIDIPGVGTTWQGAWIVQRHDLSFAIRAEVAGPSEESVMALAAQRGGEPGRPTVNECRHERCADLAVDKFSGCKEQRGGEAVDSPLCDCGEPKDGHSRPRCGEAVDREALIDALAEAVAAHVRTVLDTDAAGLPYDAALRESTGVAAECERRVVHGLRHGGGLDAVAFDVVLRRALPAWVWSR
jgi:hypothetical protein